MRVCAALRWGGAACSPPLHTPYRFAPLTPTTARSTDELGHQATNERVKTNATCHNHPHRTVADTSHRSSSNSETTTTVAASNADDADVRPQQPDHSQRRHRFDFRGTTTPRARQRPAHNRRAISRLAPPNVKPRALHSLNLLRTVRAFTHVLLYVLHHLNLLHFLGSRHAGRTNVRPA